MLVWCLITVTLFGVSEQTAARGIVIKETESIYFVDFSLYARQQKYEGSYYNYSINKDFCTKVD